MLSKGTHRLARSRRIKVMLLASAGVFRNESKGEVFRVRIVTAKPERGLPHSLDNILRWLSVMTEHGCTRSLVTYARILMLSEKKKIDRLMAPDYLE
jgi:hypothetical protein